MKDRYDYLIVGQGLAGICMSHRLLKEGKKILVVDSKRHTPASTVAAGIINPITGRRYVKSWMFDELLQEADRFYIELQEQLGDNFFNKISITRSLFNHMEEQDWWLRRQDPAYIPYMFPPMEKEMFPVGFKPVFAFAKVDKGGRTDLGKLMRLYQAYLRDNSKLLNTIFSFEDLKNTGESEWSWKDKTFERILFCEGASAVHNPYFNYLPFNPTKGEVLIIKADALKRDTIFKNRIFVAPIEEDLFWVGSQYAASFDDDLPTEDAKAFLTERLEEIMDCPYEIIEHRAAVRPTVKDRKPFLGQHSTHKGLYIFNGLGTKGASLGPYFSKMMAAHLESGEALLPEVDIKRFDK